MTDAQSMIVDHTKIGAALRRLSLPLAVQMLGDQLLGTVDTIAIGYISVGALAGVTAATTVFFTLMASRAPSVPGLSCQRSPPSS